MPDNLTDSWLLRMGVRGKGELRRPERPWGQADGGGHYCMMVSQVYVCQKS